jgi:hypothetical protein
MGNKSSKKKDSVSVQAPVTSDTIYNTYSSCINDPTSNKCTSATTYCQSLGNGAANDKLCKNYMPALCSSPNALTNIGTASACQAYALNKISWGLMDQDMTDYCNANPHAGACTCINSEITCPNKFDSACMSAGYQTWGMVNNSCPNTVLTCEQQVGLSPGAMALAVNTESNCSIDGESDSDIMNSISAVISNIKANVVRPMSDILPASITSATANNDIFESVISAPVYVYILFFVFILLILYTSIGLQEEEYEVLRSTPQ